MAKSWLASLVMTPLLLAGGAAPVQMPSFDPHSGSYGFSSDEYPGGGGSYLGVDTRNITADRVSALKLKDESGVEITMVDQDAPAGKAGLKEHDVIQTINGEKVESVEQLRRMIRELPPGRVVAIGISRDGQPQTIKVQLAERDKFMAGKMAKSFKIEIPPMPPMMGMADMDIPVSVVVVHSAMRSGLMVENLTPQLGDFFGTKNGRGVLVRSVEKGSRAEKAGFRAGDVVVRVDKDEVRDSSDFSRALRSHSGGTVSIGIIRDKKEQTLTLTLPERKQSGDLFINGEDFEFPDIDVEADIDLERMNTELARVLPQMKVAVAQARRSVEQSRKQLCEQQKELKKQQEQIQKELREHGRELQEQLKEGQEELQRELRQLHSVTTI